MLEIKRYSVRLVREESGAGYHLNSEDRITRPREVAGLMNRAFELESRTQEVFAIMCLDIKNQVVAIMPVSTGTLATASVHPRDVFQRAILANAAAIICVHNHPSGIPEPSKDDIFLTKRLNEAGKYIGIDVLDHVIIVDDVTYYSMKEHGDF